MPFFATVPQWYWPAFVAMVIVFLALDLGVFHRKHRSISFREAFAWTATWFTLAMAFAWWIHANPTFGKDKAAEFVTGYLVELSLSMDNVFVIALIFRYFKIPDEYQHRILFWGILGALVMRAVMIIAGVALVHQFDWVLYIFGVFLIYTGYRMIRHDDEDIHPENNPVLKIARRWFRFTHHFNGSSFTHRIDGKRYLTPLALALILVETTDLIFALDSIPAIIGITDEVFIIFTSNIFAILGLRSLYFVLANAINYFHYLNYGLSAVLGLIGVKMLLKDVEAAHMGPIASLVVIASILLISIIASFIWGTTHEQDATDESKPH